jgi:hypothetical protein
VISINIAVFPRACQRIVGGPGRALESFPGVAYTVHRPNVSVADLPSLAGDLRVLETGAGRFSLDWTFRPADVVRAQPFWQLESLSHTEATI